MKVFGSLFVLITIISSAIAVPTSLINPPCVDDGEYVYNNNPELTCSAIRNWEGFRLEYCRNDEVMKACPVSCGACCADDQDYTLAPFMRKRNCTWVGEKTYRREKLCDTFSSGSNGSKVRNACPVTCDYCANPIDTIKPNLADKHRDCPLWAMGGRCNADPEYMLVYCMSSCSRIPAEIQSDFIENSTLSPKKSPAHNTTSRLSGDYMDCVWASADEPYYADLAIESI